MILYLSALANVDKSLYEAAELDGAGPIRRFMTVTVPGVKVMMFLVATLTTIGCLKIFTEVYLLGGSASPTKTLTMYIRDRIVDPTFGSTRSRRCGVGVSVPHHLRLHHCLPEPAEEG